MTPKTLLFKYKIREIFILTAHLLKFIEKTVEKNNTLHEPSPKHNGGSCDTPYVVEGSYVMQMYNADMSWESDVLLTLEI